MHEIARVTLANEMDLILAHKRSMKLAEIVGLSLPAQTTFATAVSEVARNTIESGKSGCLILNVESDDREKYIVACVKDELEYSQKSMEGLAYAKRLVNKYNVSTKGAETSIELFYYINPSFRIDIHKLDEWRTSFRNEPPISAYDELKRKNEQLEELSEKVKKSEAQYKTLTNSLPLIIFTLDKEGNLLYANEWLLSYSGQSREALNEHRWKMLVHADDYAAFHLLLTNNQARYTTTVKMQVRLLNLNGEYLWHQVSLSPLPFLDEKPEPQYWIGYMADVHAQKVVEETLQDNRELKETQAQLKEVQQEQEKYIDELNRSNHELQQFAFVASHDLQEPVRKLLFYSDYLLSQHTDAMEGKSLNYLKSIQQSANRMRVLIKDLLVYSQIKKEEIKFHPIDLNKIAEEACGDFEMRIEETGAKINIDNLPSVLGDEGMIRQLLENLISNSLKYSLKNESPRIDIRGQVKEEMVELEIKDNGIGFNETYLPQMFTLFQRLHNRTSYEGTGLGLAICKKIVDIHGGKIWAKSKEGEGATFYVSLPVNSQSKNPMTSNEENSVGR